VESSIVVDLEGGDHRVYVEYNDPGGLASPLAHGRQHANADGYAAGGPMERVLADGRAMAVSVEGARPDCELDREDS
jgi:hypothetical protein